MRKLREEIITFILNFLAENPQKFIESTTIQQKFAISRQQATRYLNFLAQEGNIDRQGKGRGTKYFLNGDFTKIFSLAVKTETLAKWGEDRIYHDQIGPVLNKLNLDPNIMSIFNHGITEMLNNVIDHSQSKNCEIQILNNSRQMQIKIADNGIGIFLKNQVAFQLPDLLEAIAETAKGKRTSQPERHAGEGIFFTSRLFEQFSLSANGLIYTYFSEIDDYTIEQVLSPPLPGTMVTLQIAKNSQRVIDDIFGRYTEDYAFVKHGRLLVEPFVISLGTEPVSRSEAKRILKGAEKFKSLVLDFKNTHRIGQGFADEIFAVFARTHPEISFEIRNANPIVLRMIEHARKR